MAGSHYFSQEINLRLILLRRERQRLLLQDIMDSRNRHIEDLNFLSFTQRSIHLAKLRQDRRQLALKTKSDDGKHLNIIPRPLSSKVVDFVKNREYGFSTRPQSSRTDKEFLNQHLPDFVSQHLPAILREHEFKLGTINKVFASQWLNDSQIAFGTKCNKLLVMNLRNSTLFHIHSLRSSPESIPATCPCGIHSMAINPSRTMLATGGHNTNDLAVYELPTFDPLCVGEGAHKDWIFDMEWLDDEHIITGSRDSTVALWRINCQDSLKNDDELSSSSLSVPGHKFIKHCSREICQNADKVRALAVSHDKGLMGVLSMNAKFHYWDIETFTQLQSIKLRWPKENVCATSSDDLHLFAIGSQDHVTTLDHRDRRISSWVKIPCNLGERGIRSLNINQYVVSIGTGDGRVLFHDLRMKKYLSNEFGNNCELLVGNGWLQYDDNLQMHCPPGLFPNAVYTHCYDENRTRLFVAGGPLPAQLHGNYGGLYC